MEDKQKLTAAILSAIAAYLQIEQPPSATPLPKSEEEVSQHYNPTTDNAK